MNRHFFFGPRGTKETRRYKIIGKGLVKGHRVIFEGGRSDWGIGDIELVNRIIIIESNDEEYSNGWKLGY